MRHTGRAIFHGLGAVAYIVLAIAAIQDTVKALKPDGWDEALKEELPDASKAS